MASNLYLLPCDECQHSLELQKRQAGQTVTCPQCGHSFAAPRLGEFKNLQTTASGELEPTTGSTSVLKRWLFTLGLAMTVLLGAAGVGVYQFAGSIQEEIHAESRLEDYNKDIEQFSDAEVYQIAATYTEDQTLGEYFQPGLVKNNKQGEILEYVAYGLLGLAALGLAMLVGSFLVK